ncbi:MAG: hypothetical protein HY332_22120 [Chloroflexi bacterium]|nr:hypothetical protein [Chloroflexota bacterium]
MAFTVSDFHDLLRLLEEHPEWRAELRRHVLPDQLLELPALVRQLVEAQARTDARIEQLVEAQARTDARIEQLVEQMVALTARVDQLTARVDQLTEQVQALTGEVRLLRKDVDELRIDVGQLKGSDLEQRYRTRAPAYFSRIARRLRVVEHTRLADVLDDAVAEGRLTEAERDAVLETDLVLRGQRREDQAEVYLLVEVSAGIRPYDVERASDRAASLAKVGRPVVPVVAGESSNRDADELARQRGVWRVLDGRTG